MPVAPTPGELEAAALEGRQIGGDLDEPTALALLAEGELSVVGRLLAASNATFYCLAARPASYSGPGHFASCVYKPVRGERPLYDFPDGTLARREVAAFAVSAASGWDVVPPTVLRDGPFGPGMVQLWMEIDPTVEAVDLVNSDLPALRQIAVLDAVLNNADRKGGHMLPLPDGRILGIDNGLSFAVEPKLRTVLWRWRGQPLDEPEVAGLERLAAAMTGELGARLGDLLSLEEVAATADRLQSLLAQRRFPRPDRNRPAIPWPPF